MTDVPERFSAAGSSAAKPSAAKPSAARRGVAGRLRSATAAQHATLEAATNIQVALASDRVRLLLGYWRFHAAVEAAMAPWLTPVPEVEYRWRTRSTLLARALAAYRHIPPAPPPFLLASFAAAMGALYVTEGSTLGGRLILRAAQASGANLLGLEFFDPYADETGQMWRRLLAVMETHVAGPAALADATDAARATFVFAADCLTPATVGAYA